MNILNTFIILLISDLCTCVNIAIIGAGIGGGSAAYHLSKFFKDAHIDAFEKSNRVGGRLMSKPFLGSKYEIGGSIIHPKNKYMVDLSAKFGLQSKSKSTSNKFGIHNGKEFVFVESGFDFMTILKLVYRYGTRIARLQVLINLLLKDFSWIYQLQEDGIKFCKTEELLASMSYKFPAMLNKKLDSYLNELGFDGLLKDELIQAVSLVNYGQSVDKLHSFVGAVSIAGADPALWSIKGGNEKMVEKLFEKSKTKVNLNTKISEIQLLNNGSYRLFLNKNNKLNDKIYDAVIIAAPLYSKNIIKFTNLPQALSKKLSRSFHNLKYHQTIATLIQGTAKDGSVAQDVISCDPNSFYYSMARLTPIVSSGEDSQNEVYKVFSREPLTKDQLNTLFHNITAVDTTVWDAYPEYLSGAQSNSKLDFILHPGLFYVNAIEWAASAMEMSLISGKNAAFLAKYHLMKTSPKLDFCDIHIHS